VAGARQGEQAGGKTKDEFLHDLWFAKVVPLLNVAHLAVELASQASLK
jgi:hypothetical protein